MALSFRIHTPDGIIVHQHFFCISTAVTYFLGPAPFVAQSQNFVVEILYKTVRVTSKVVDSVLIVQIFFSVSVVWLEGYLYA